MLTSPRRWGLLVGALLVPALTVLAPGWASSSEDVEAGQQVFAANCAMCHGEDAAGMRGMHPSLRGAVQRLSLEGVEVTVRNGRDTDPPMPAFAGRLTDEEIRDVIAYVDSLPEGPRNFGPGSRDRGMMGGDMMAAGWATFLLGLVAGVVGGLLTVSAVWLLRDRRQGSRRDTAREELDRRYATGELSREEYLQRRHDLS